MPLIHVCLLSAIFLPPPLLPNPASSRKDGIVAGKQKSNHDILTCASKQKSHQHCIFCKADGFSAPHIEPDNYYLPMEFHAKAHVPEPPITHRDISHHRNPAPGTPWNKAVSYHSSFRIIKSLSHSKILALRQRKGILRASHIRIAHAPLEDCAFLPATGQARTVSEKGQGLIQCRDANRCDPQAASKCLLCAIGRTWIRNDVLTTPCPCAHALLPRQFFRMVHFRRIYHCRTQTIPRRKARISSLRRLPIRQDPCPEETSFPKENPR